MWCKIGTFSDKYHVQFGHFVTFSGKYHAKLGHFVNFHTQIFGQNAPPPKDDWAPTPMSLLDFASRVSCELNCLKVTGTAELEIVLLRPLLLPDILHEIAHFLAFHDGTGGGAALPVQCIDRYRGKSSRQWSK